MNVWPLLVLALVAAPATAAARDLAGRYRLAEGPDVAGQLELTKDHRFGYALAAGALDERAQGTWELRRTPGGEQACLTTTPTPVPPQLQAAPVPPDQDATVRVVTATGRGIAGVDFLIGFDQGEPLGGYTQSYGWTLPEDERRVPRWIELQEPIHRIALARTPFQGSRFAAVLIPNDLGVVNFQEACLEATKEGFVLHRLLPDGSVADMRFRKVDR